MTNLLDWTCVEPENTISLDSPSPMDPPKYASVDDLQAQTTLQEAAAKCGVTLEVHGSGRQVRLDCPFGCPGDHAGKRELSVDTGNPQKVFACHAYNCQLRGNLLTLMHGWLTGTRPTGDKLKGDEFNRVRRVLAGDATPPPSGAPQKPTSAAEQRTVEPPRRTTRQSFAPTRPRTGDAVEIVHRRTT